MAEGISVALPLRVDSVDGAYGLNKNLEDMASQNLKMLILTSPGERIMFPDYGVRIRQYLFDPNNSNTAKQIRGSIEEQARKYLPYIQITNLQVFSPVDSGLSGEAQPSRINIIIGYRVPSANIVSNLTIPVTI